MNFYTTTIPQATRFLLDNIKEISDIKNFYLTGGTALSLLLGHRESEDLDFFSENLTATEAAANKVSSVVSNFIHSYIKYYYYYYWCGLVG